jgi:hypothetical protein
MAKGRTVGNPRTYFFRRLRKHFGVDPGKLVLVTQKYQTYDRPNIHLALDQLLASDGIGAELEGIILVDSYENVSLAKLSREVTAQRFVPGPVEYRDVELADGKRLSCVQRGIYWVKTPRSAVVMLINEGTHQFPPAISIEVMGVTREAAEDFGRALGTRVAESAAFRGHVLSLELDCHHQMSVRFHRLPRIARDEIILPADVLQRLDRQTMGIVQHAEQLRKAGRHLKRGVLLHGPPGTGKTLSAMYLATQMPGRTVLILTGGSMNLIETTGVLARALAPVTVIVEDVDLIGTLREHQTVGANALLFELLNQMDGLAEDADVLFVLTTNRPDVLEPALAARPGRIDQAIEIPLPDKECRGRLIDLYSKGIDLRMRNKGSLIDRTNGVSGAFVRELLRRATILSLESAATSQFNGNPPPVDDGHVDMALNELVVAGGRFTQSLLGGLKAGQR